MHQQDGSHIALFDLASGAIQEIAIGIAPAWSPFDDRIAYLDDEGSRCFLVRADATDKALIHDARKHVFGARTLYRPIIWAPDGKKLLLTRLKGEEPKFDIVLVDLNTGEANVKLRNGFAVNGWASSAHN